MELNQCMRWAIFEFEWVKLLLEVVAFICQHDHTAWSNIPRSSADWFASVLLCLAKSQTALMGTNKATFMHYSKVDSSVLFKLNRGSLPSGHIWELVYSQVFNSLHVLCCCSHLEMLRVKVQLVYIFQFYIVEVLSDLSLDNGAYCISGSCC